MCGKVDPDWWTAGIPTGETTGPYDAEGRPLCCIDGPECNCLSPVFDSLICEITDITDCANLAQTILLTRDDQVCSWDGTYAVEGGFALMRFSWVGPGADFQLVTTCDDTSPIDASGTLCPGLDVEFIVDDDAGFGCCSSGPGPGQYKIHVHD